MRRVASSETWIKPSTPGSSLTKAPKSAIRLTTPRTVDPTEYLASALAHGLSTRSRIDRPIFPVSLSTFLTMAWTCWPISRNSFGSLTLSHASWLTWTRPSTPWPISIKAPNSLIERTIPSTCAPGSSVSSIFDFSSAACFSITARRDKTRRRAWGTTSVTRLSSVWPIISSGLSIRHGLMRLIGIKPRIPATSHSSPPLFAAVHRASTIMPTSSWDQSSTVTARFAGATS